MLFRATERRCSVATPSLKRRCNCCIRATTGEYVGDEEAYGLRLLLVVGA